MPFGKESRRDKFYADPVEQARYTFSNHYKDEETGLIFMQARYYDPSLGRFITADTIVQDPTNPVTMNRYHYAGNNPVNNIDPNGHGFFRKLFKIFNKVFLPLIPDKYKGIVIGVALTLAGLPQLGAALSSAYNTALNGGSFGDFARGVGIGIVTAGVGGAIGEAVGSSLGGFLGAAVSGAVAGGVGSVLTGGSFGDGAGQGAAFAAAGYLAVKSFDAVSNKIRTNKIAKKSQSAGEIVQELNKSNGPIAKSMLADAFRESQEQFFGYGVDPRPLAELFGSIETSLLDVVGGLAKLTRGNVKFGINIGILKVSYSLPKLVSNVYKNGTVEIASKLGGGNISYTHSQFGKVATYSFGQSTLPGFNARGYTPFVKTYGINDFFE